MYVMRSKRTGAIVTGIVALAALSGITVAFLKSGSPYVTVAEAKGSKGDSLHLAGSIDLATLRDDRIHNKLSFTLIDRTGARMQVVHTGEPVNNLGEAKQVVAIGHVENGVFVSEKMLVKCPTKYEGVDSKSGA